MHVSTGRGNISRQASYLEDHMPITQADIVKIERDWRVEIEKLPDGSYEVTSDSTHRWDQGVPTAWDTQYKLTVRPIEDEVNIDPKYAEALGVELTGDKATDWANLSRTAFENAEGAENFHSDHPAFTGSHLNRTACVGAWLRSNGEIPPKSWNANPAFGASGAGATIEPGGGQGGAVSTIGPAHDTDMTLGVMANVGPMKDLTAETSGMHGIPNVANKLGKHFAEKEYQKYLDERETMPELKNIPAYDNPTASGPGWSKPRNTAPCAPSRPAPGW